MTSSSLYLLDTTIITYVLNGHSMAVRKRLKEESQNSTVIFSTISQAEVLFGLENKPGATRLRSAVDKLFSTVPIASWDVAAAQAYSKLRVRLAKAGKNLTALDMLIAAHAISIGATLVTHDKAFRHAKPFVDIVDWAIDL